MTSDKRDGAMLPEVKRLLSQIAGRLALTPANGGRGQGAGR